MRLRFTKMHGIGNDFVVLDATRTPLALAPAQLRRLADRHFGIGCDQILLIEPPKSPGTDFHYRIFNADGGEVEQCGNGARCGVIVPRLEPDGQVSVNMGVPVFEPARIPFEAHEQALTYSLALGKEVIEISMLSIGNPHAVQVVAEVTRAPVSKQGPAIEKHPRFPQGANAGFLEVVDRSHGRLRVYERGAGETLACGTGACAAVVAGIARGLFDSSVAIAMRGGGLGISWEGPGAPVIMTGPAATVFEGEIEL
jgi:diaminopimelate epimerase